MNKIANFVTRPLARCVICGTIVCMNVLHPLFHGTIVDQGAFDPILATLDLWALQFSSSSS